MKIDHDKENNIVTLSWGKLKENHIGLSEEINLIGVTIVIDRDKKGYVKALEIMVL
jgi:hypothetical protein